MLGKSTRGVGAGRGWTGTSAGWLSRPGRATIVLAAIALAGIGLATLLALQLPARTAGAERAPGQSPDLDPSQAYRMLDFLDAVARGEPTPEHLDAVMAAEGTRLIVGQLNLVRKASHAQYREVLEALAEGREPALEPVDGSRRAARGVDGLVGDVWPALRWGVDHVDALRDRVDHLAGISFYRRARALASRFLPDSLRAAPTVYVVAGGRAGAASLGTGIYVDVLVYSHRNRRTGGFPDDDAILRTVAHELHHAGYVPYLNRLADTLRLGGGDALLFDLVSGLMIEGSATYLISERRDVQRMRESDPYRGHLADPGVLVATIDALMTAVIEGRVRSRQDYDDATADLVGSWFHSAGSFLLSVIDEAQGEDAVRAVIEDPRRLPAAYNRALRALDRPGLRPFDHRITEALASGRADGSVLLHSDP